MKKNVIENGGNAGAVKNSGESFFIDDELSAIIDAQCEEHKVDRKKFLKFVIRLFLDFNYMARITGKDIFTFRDELIKTIVKSTGGQVSARVEHTERAGSGEAGRAGGGEKGKLDEILRELRTLRGEVAELKLKNGRQNSEHQPQRRHEGAARDVEAISETGNMFESEIYGRSAVERVEVSPPASSYKEKRKKLIKIKF